MSRIVALPAGTVAVEVLVADVADHEGLLHRPAALGKVLASVGA